MVGDAAAAAGPPAEIDTSVSHSARIWNYWLGGKDNYAADREAGDRVAAMLPSIVAQARADRAFLGRAIRYLAGEEGIRQFLDIGTGLPTASNIHEVAQRVAPRSRIVYVDNDPLVLARARALLTSTPEGRCGYIDGDLRDPDAILTGPARTCSTRQRRPLTPLHRPQPRPDGQPRITRTAWPGDRRGHHQPAARRPAQPRTRANPGRARGQARPRSWDFRRYAYPPWRNNRYLSLPDIDVAKW